jgi:hypothetical protein
VNATARNIIRRTATTLANAVRNLTPEAVYHLLNGHHIQQWLNNGDLITTNTWLDQNGAEPDFLDGYRSWYGRAVASSYRARHNGQNPARAWVRHRTTGRWIHVFVYFRNDPSLIAGAAAYHRTRHLVPTQQLAA